VPVGYVDAFRVVNPHADQYTWWSNRGRARENNVGWRLDYMAVTPGLRPKVRAESVYRDERFSDHAPLTMDFDWPCRAGFIRTPDPSDRHPYQEL
jgi:exodeoxyribonuclease-3